jgi:FdhE protein
MAQRILERGEIETLLQRSIPRVRLPERSQLFSRRAARLRELAADSALGPYLHMLAAIADAQQAALATFHTTLPTPGQIALAREHKMPPLHATSWPRDPAWRELPRTIAAAAAGAPGAPAALAALAARIREATPEWVEAQADAVLAARNAHVDTAAAPFVVAALQVHWSALTAAFVADDIGAIDVHGVCPSCGSLPVASIVAAQAPYQGYRYMHCALCATEWHMVRVHCSHCGANGKDIAFRYLEKEGVQSGEQGLAALRAETCEQCRSYRKIVYQEKDPQVEPLADDVASIALDLLLAEDGYHRVSPNPLLWQSTE